MRPPIWIYYTIALLGLYLFFTTITFHTEISLLISGLLSAFLLIGFSLHARKNPTNFSHWAIVFVAIWLQCAPLFFWATSEATYCNDTLIGCFVIALAVIFFPLPKQLPDDEPSIPPGWSYNPSSWPQRMPIILSAFLCWMISRYLGAYELGYIDSVWDPFFTPGAKGVLESSVAKLFPVPDAGLGAFAYTLEFLAACLGGKSRWRTAPWLILVFGFLVIPVGLVSVILVILQPLIVGTWCTLCLITAATMLIAVPLALDEILASFQYLQQTKWKTLFSGGKSPKAGIDKSSPSLQGPLWEICKAGFWGVKIHWYQICLIPIGIFLMALPSYYQLHPVLFDIDPIIGALTIATAVISLSEKAKKILLLNVLLGLLLLAAAFFSMDLAILHIPIGGFIIALSLFSPMREGCPKNKR